MLTDKQRAEGWIDPPAVFESAFLWIEPIYRGPERPQFGVRRACGPVCAFDWSLDGGPDDIIAYRPGNA